MAQLNLLEGRISTLIVKMALPASVGFFFTTLYNLIDTFWASRVSEEAVAGLGISFPIFLLMLGVAIGLGQGTTVLTSHAVGARDEERAGRTVVQAVLLSIAASAALAIGGGLVMKPLFAQLSPDPATAQAGWDYFSIILFCNFFFLASFALNGALNAVGDTVTYSLVSIASTFINAALDPLFIYGWSLGDLQIIPAMGLQGIAWATVIAQALGLVYVAYRVSAISLWPHIIKQRLRIHWPTQGQILGQGVPATFNMFAVSMGFVIMLAFIRPYGTAATAGFAAGLRIEQLALLPAVGLNTAAMSLVGQNFGAARYDRVLESFRKSTLYALFVLGVGGILVFVFAEILIQPFAASADAARMAVIYLKIITFEYLGLAIVMLCGGFLQAMKYPNIAMLITIFRLALAPLVLMPFFAYTLGFGYQGVWYGVLTGTYSFGIIAIACVLWVAQKKLAAYPADVLGIRKVAS